MSVCPAEEEMPAAKPMDGGDPVKPKEETDGECRRRRRRRGYRFDVAPRC